MISFNCTSCGKKLRVKDSFAGQTGQCPSCGGTMHIPDKDCEEAPPAPVYEAEPVDTEGYDVREEQEREPEPEPRKRPKKKRRSQHEDEWEAGEDVKNHAGNELTRKDDFFVPPPSELGEIVSATTSLRRGAHPMEPGTRMAIGIGAGFVGLVFGVIIAVGMTQSPFWQLFWPVVLGGGGLGISLLATGFSHTCTYVGRDGVARYRCSGTRENVTEELFFFDDATELRTSQTRHYTNGVYQRTDYSYTWSDAGGRKRFVIGGSHKSEQGNPGPKDAYHFALSAEQAWTFHLFGTIQGQLNTGGTIFFGLGGKNWVRLGEGFISVHMNGQTTECDAEDIDQVRIDQGEVQVRRKDAREGWFSSRGVFKFPYGSLANAHLFVILMDKLVGVPINS